MNGALKSIIILFVLILQVGCVQKSKRPNIILVLTDDQGYGDVSAHGSPDVATPYMDKLKSQGISLEDFQVSPTCAPSRSAILTGRYPFKNGVTHTILERERMALGITTLPEILKSGGYTSGIFGKWHLGDENAYQPENRGFDEVFIHGAGGIGQAYVGSCADVPGNEYFDPIIKHNGTFVKTKGYCTDVFFTQALAWIKDKSQEEQPFFAYIATNAPHSPFIAPESYKAKFAAQDYPENAQGFYGMIENIDDNLGRLLEKLDEWNLDENTILIFMSDNGKSGRVEDDDGWYYNAGMKGRKGSVDEGGTRVPFFIRWPNEFAAGEKVETLLNHYDLLPTIADISEIDISEISDLDGQSFLPLLKDQNYKVTDRYRFFHGGRWPLNPENTNQQEGSERWVGTLETANPENAMYKKCAVRNEQYRFVNNQELYDVINDPGQKRDLAAEYPEIVAEMRQVYIKWWNEMSPYLINETVPLATEKPFWTAYEKQKKLGKIKAWEMPRLD